MESAVYVTCPVCGYRHCPIGEPCPNCDLNPASPDFSTDLVDHLNTTIGRLTKSSLAWCNAGSRALDRA